MNTTVGIRNREMVYTFFKGRLSVIVVIATICSHLYLAGCSSGSEVPAKKTTADIDDAAFYLILSKGGVVDNFAGPSKRKSNFRHVWFATSKADNVDDETVRTISKMSNLGRVNLDYTKITDASLSYLGPGQSH
jgi:hypothetical protein